MVTECSVGDNHVLVVTAVALTILCTNVRGGSEIPRSHSRRRGRETTTQVTFNLELELLADGRARVNARSMEIQYVSDSPVPRYEEGDAGR